MMFLFLALLSVIVSAQGKECYNAHSEPVSKMCPCEKDPTEKVDLDFYYGTNCPYSRDRYAELEKAVKELGPQLNVTTCPFGTGKMHLDGPKMTIQCKEESECYGNKLHACAIYILKEPAVYIPFNLCMMRHNIWAASNDEAADACGRKLYADSESIKDCAKGIRGFQQLLNCGVESEKSPHPTFPWWHINDVPASSLDLKKPLVELLCDALKNPPESCRKYSY